MELEPLSVNANKFLRVLKHFEGKKITLKEYSLMLGVSRRLLRYAVSELRAKKYIKVIPEHMKIYHLNACRYIFLDQPQQEQKSIAIDEGILKRLGVDINDI